MSSFEFLSLMHMYIFFIIFFLYSTISSSTLHTASHTVQCPYSIQLNVLMRDAGISHHYMHANVWEWKRGKARRVCNAQHKSLSQIYIKFEIYMRNIKKAKENNKNSIQSGFKSIILLYLCEKSEIIIFYIET